MYKRIQEDQELKIQLHIYCCYHNIKLLAVVAPAPAIYHKVYTNNIPPFPVLHYFQGISNTLSPNVATEYLDPGTHFYLDFRFFNKFYFQTFISVLTIVDATTSHLFDYPTISKCPPLQLINISIQFFRPHGYKISILRFDEVGELSRSVDFMQIFIYHEVNVDTTGVYASTIRLNVERPRKTIKNTVCIQLLSYRHFNDICCFCYQYNIWVTSHLIKRRLGTAPIVAWYKQNDISYTIPLKELVIW